MLSRSERIKLLIEGSGKSYQELEKLTGVKKSSLQRYASGATAKIPLTVIEKLAKAFHVSQNYLMGWEDDNSPAPDQLFGFTEQLTEDEKKWLDLYRNATEDVREKMVFIVESIAELQSNDQQSVTKKMRDSSRRK